MDEIAGNAAGSSLAQVPGLKQVILLVGLAASIAAGIGIVLWSQEPDHQMLYGNLDERDAGAVVQALDAAGIEYSLDDTTGGILVPSEQVHAARLRLAAEGLPQGGGMGVEMIQGETGFGVSQFMEGARYQHALETELARTIVNMRSVEAARVHLALPRQSVFLRERRPPSASVLLHLYSGRQLSDPQVESIVHLVASSIPGLEAPKVTVVDQFGRLLSRKEDDSDAARNGQQFEQQRRLEEIYAERIQDMLAPILGAGRVRATVAAELDFTVSEETREVYDPDRSVIRSEQIREDRRMRPDGPEGVPGALSNQPPETVADAGVEYEAGGDAEQPMEETRESTRNFEVDRTVSHVRAPTGTIRRLSAAVLVDHRRSVGEDGAVVAEPLTDAELDEVRALVRDSVGFSEERGDTVTVINASFTDAPAVEPLPEAGLLEQGWVRDAIRQIAAVAVLVLVIFGVVRPALTGLGLTTPPQAIAAGGGGVRVEVQPQDAPAVEAPRPALSYEERVAAARNMAAQNPERVAQMMKDWVSDSG